VSFSEIVGLRRIEKYLIYLTWGVFTFIDKGIHIIIIIIIIIIIYLLVGIILNLLQGFLSQ
jgi:hypothetical protein